MIRKVFVDMDGVLCNFVAGALKAHKRKFEELVPNVWNFNETLCIEPAAFWNKLKGPSFWWGLPWMDDGKAILDMVERKFGQSNVCLLTSPPLDPQSAAGKMVWIADKLPAYKRQFLIGPKKEFCAGPDKLLIDDSENNVAAFQKEGGQAILVPRFWNSAHAQADRAVSVVESLLPIGRTTCPTPTT